jgi:hypothetical protein
MLYFIFFLLILATFSTQIFLLLCAGLAFWAILNRHYFMPLDRVVVYLVEQQVYYGAYVCHYGYVYRNRRSEKEAISRRFNYEPCRILWCKTVENEDIGHQFNQYCLTSPITAGSNPFLVDNVQSLIAELRRLKL